MIALLRQIILCVTAASLFCAVVLSLVPDSALKEVIRMGTGLVLLLSLVIPLRQSLPKVLTDSLPQLTAPAQEDTEQIYQQAVLEQVQVQAAQYAAQQAETLGIQCTVSVVAAAGEDGEIVIQSIGIVTDSPVSAQKCTELRAKLSNDLGITDDCIDIM